MEPEGLPNLRQPFFFGLYSRVYKTKHNLEAISKKTSILAFLRQLQGNWQVLQVW